MPNENGQYVVWAVWNDGSRGVHHFANLAAAQAKWDAYEALPLNTSLNHLPPPPVGSPSNLIQESDSTVTPPAAWRYA